jgi:hypothetical protein
MGRLLMNARSAKKRSIGIVIATISSSAATNW